MQRKLYTKQEIAVAHAVTPRTVDNWKAQGLLPPPIKLGSAAQSRVRWTVEAVAELDRNLENLGRMVRPGLEPAAG